jgi:hypothetical protein
VGSGGPLPNSAPRRGVARCASSPSRRAVKKSTLAIESGLVPYLRKGVLREMTDALQILQVEVAEDVIDVSVYDQALARFDQTRALLAAIELNETADARELRIDDERLRGLIVGALKMQHELERSRLEDAAVDGVQLDPREVPALGNLVAQLRSERAPARSPCRRFLRQPRRHRGS